MLKQLLHHPFGRSNAILHLIDGDNGKQNTHYLISPTNSGKSMFFDLLADYFLCPGMLRNWNRTNSFPIEELATARIAFWSEPSYDVSYDEDELLK